MILTCPECATRYFLPDVQIGRGGRRVRCAQCEAVWREYPLRGAQAEEDFAVPEPPAAAAPEPEPEAEAELSSGAARRAEILREKKAAAQRKATQAATVNAAVWAGLAAAVVILLGLAMVFREQVVQLSPGTATAYAAIGMPVNSTGLMIEKVRAVPSLLQGHRALAVTGVLRNVAAVPVPAPAFRVDVLDRNGRDLDHKTIQISAPPLKVGEARPFSLGVADPPAGYADVSVTLVLPDARPQAPAPADAAPPVAAPAPAPAASPTPVPAPLPAKVAPPAKTGAR
ncbi:MAG: hypothetical protein JWO72_1034 [Caulobacteraceae bacterium]|nr:hypothetical protein [Caulobacteraceae bacterium]